jgi:uncharacterized protein YkwD
LTVAFALAVAAALPEAVSPAATSPRAATKLEARVAARVNLVRRWHGLRPLRLSHGLTQSARRHSREMAAKGYFDHESAGGEAFWRRIERTYASRGFGRWEVGENIAWSSQRATAAQIVRQWMSSPTHRDNVLSPAWRDYGVGALRVRRARGAYGGRSATIVTLDLGIRIR